MCITYLECNNIQSWIDRKVIFPDLNYIGKVQTLKRKDAWFASWKLFWNFNTRLAIIPFIANGQGLEMHCSTLLTNDHIRPYARQAAVL